MSVLAKENIKIIKQSGSRVAHEPRARWEDGEGKPKGRQPEKKKEIKNEKKGKKRRKKRNEKRKEGENFKLRVKPGREAMTSTYRGTNK